jgi:hypothetical protein
MAKTMVTSENILINGQRFAKTVTQSFDNVAEFAPTLAAAKTGTLTVRTSNSVGTLTMSSGHGIGTAGLFDMYWFNSDGTLAGARRAVIAGTVSTNSVPITGGSGDNLPTAASAIVAMLRDTESNTIAGDNIKAILVYSPVPCFVVFAASDDTVLFSVPITAVNGVYRWNYDSGVTNPLAGVTVAKILITHSDSDASQVPQVVLGFV